MPRGKKMKADPFQISHFAKNPKIADGDIIATLANSILRFVSKSITSLRFMHRTQGGYFCLTKEKMGYSENSRTYSRVCPTHSALLEWPAPLEVRSSEPMHERLEEADYADDETDYAEDEKPAQIGTCARWLVWASGHPP